MKTYGRNVPALAIPMHSVGMLSALESAFEFDRWASSQRVVTAESIKDRFQVSRATSYRWLRSWQCSQERHQPLQAAA